MSTFNFKPNLLATAIAFSFSSPLIAAEKSALNEVVVSATRTEQNINDVSASVETVSNNEIDDTMASDPKQALQYTPGVDAQGSGRFGISGYNIRGMEDSRVKVMVDGVQQPTSYNPGSNEQRFYPNDIEIDTLSAIEINKGPSSTLYGSDALGGVVLFKTKDPSDVLINDGNENRFGIKSSYTSADETFKNTLTWAMRQGKFETLLMVTYADGYETETYGDGADISGPDRGAADPADKNIGNVLGKAYYQINDAHRIGLTVEYYQRQYDEDELSYDGYSMTIPSMPMPLITYNDSYNQDTSERLRVGLSHDWSMNTLLADQLAWSINYQMSDSLSKNHDTTTGMMGTGKRMRKRDASDDSIQFDAQFDKLIEANHGFHQLTYGANFMHNKFKIDNSDHKYDLATVGPGNTGMPDATLVKWGAFIQDQAFLLDERVILTAGLRYDSFKTSPKTDDGFTTEYPENKSDSFTGKIGTVYHFSDHFSSFAQISQGFKAPTVYDLYYFYNQGAIVDANPDLQPEKSLSYELGVRGQNQSARFELVGFYNDYSDFITDQYLGKVGNKDHYSKSNIANAEIYGVEFSSTILLDQAFNAPQGIYSKFSVAYAEGRDKDSGDHLDSVAPLTGNVGVGYYSVNHTFGGLVNITMAASKNDWSQDDNFVAAGYSLVDLTTYYRPIQDLTLRAGLFNALDKKYWLYSDLNGKKSGENQDFYTQSGRNWGVSLDYQF
ncbi:TonB-dependent hemoglobin/transferrin/lactoferrin family receptor [Vibrio sp. S11_S32]|uniref:TonB-dependent hemoglobin/transferrin/lactoferrin family receptor n=1 Tax=Vibrio sp. S11_S32 TaxID=2720225 RepID=UPI0016814C5E|nr:TonB-dependent hemoglobin/transferrin/lactoferrin family receptor [Vibrio sp. S11_S32]MBD1576604.1 TonB-dependent hemoglobin/transferrin/lactoferrin family receptor [Vibrio sp. S11_S32]